MAIAMTLWCPPGEEGASVGEAANRCLESWMHGLVGVGSLHVGIGDDGSADEAHARRLAETAEHFGATASVVVTDRLGCGGALNAAVGECLPHSEVIDYQQADWLLTEPLDLAPSLALLNSGTADIVRLGPTHPGLRAYIGRTNIPGAEWCLEYDWAYGGYVVGWRPALYHRRVFERFPLDGLSGLSACEAERVWLERVADSPNRPRVFHAPNCTLAGPFRHIDTIELGDDDPATLTEKYRDG